MRILFLSSLPETNSGGPKHSVPRQVNAQAKYDEVRWINMSPWGSKETGIPCEIITDSNKVILEIENFTPDLVIFEDFQYLDYIEIARRLRKAATPYIIVPRGSMTKAAQKHKFLKKLVANVLLFNRFARKAAAIEYLTEKEKENSSTKWNKKSLIIPNGTDYVEERKRDYNTDSLTGVFIGRLNPYHKGLDQFLPACGELSSLIKEKKVIINMYGPAEKGIKEQLEGQVEEYGLSDNIHFYCEVHGKEKVEILRDADFFILTSRFEGMPMGLIEALAYGLPVLITEETNMGDIISVCNAGLVSKCNMEEIRNNIEILLNLSKEEFIYLGKNAYTLSQRYNWDKIAEDAHEQYLRLIGG